jgi:hypothetical protein
MNKLRFDFCDMELNNLRDYIHEEITQLKPQLIDALTTLAHCRTPEAPNLGICYNLTTMVTGRDSLYHFVALYAKTWPKDSGIYNFPVTRRHNCNKWTEEEGKERRELCLHLIDVLQLYF